ncbi:MAG: hypothetical protein ACXWQO_14910 [Bdellovibrionota bacterium]
MAGQYDEIPRLRIAKARQLGMGLGLFKLSISFVTVRSLTFILTFLANILMALALTIHAQMNALKWVALGFTALVVGTLLAILFAFIADKILRMDEKYLPWSFFAYMLTPFVGVAVSLFLSPLPMALVLVFLK